MLRICLKNETENAGKFIRNKLMLFQKANKKGNIQYGDGV